jgi:hypothetical protein
MDHQDVTGAGLELFTLRNEAGSDTPPRPGTTHDYRR